MNNKQYIDSDLTARGSERKIFRSNVRGKKGESNLARLAFQHDYCKDEKPIITIEHTNSYPIYNVWKGCMFTQKNRCWGRERIIKGTYASQLMEYLRLTSEAE